ncbi:YggS family pyridoxal phosphate-dependent enzyme [Motilibacter aurantiacus]|uniref:YggS family pyridoxal phosphate-dependent enzyme n=1 Tax=Motilibacter aurantiacus TaxID=2714955 RepID=UPI00140C7790|nr:YggS family pyridoxal phosphate-dependent enzyme [Motilibacter aurantiacus]
MSRRDELAERLSAVEERVVAACREAGRDRAEVTVIAVTKTYPASDVELLGELGVRDVAENREQEAGAKAAECARLGLCWHFVGQLQTNKASAVARWADVVHSVDRERLVPALQRGAEQAGRVLDCLLQVALDEDAAAGAVAARGGAAPQEVERLAEAVDGSASLRLRGVMAVAPLGADARAAFDRLAAVSERLRVGRPGASVISAGMSGDLEAAVLAGATHLRVGSAILGKRPPLR